MIIVTGGAGFIGSNLVRALNRRGRDDVLVVDNLADERKIANLAGARVRDYLDKDDFLARLGADRDDPRLDGVEAVLHQGACSSTTEADGRYLLRNNYEYSRAVLAFCQRRGVPLIYASSAAVYGTGTSFREERDCEAPRNAYGFSKLLFDEHVRQTAGAARVVGLRYFNVYGPGEAHKGAMASVLFQLRGQLARTGRVRLFRGTDGDADGEQRRDFVYVADVVALNLWFLDGNGASGVYNAGSGRARSFNDVARAVLAHQGRGEIEYIDFPEALRGRYQRFTEADLGRLRATGYTADFTPLEVGSAEYLAQVEA